MNEISFSIIIPLYNKAQSIENTLNSVLAINYASYEVVVVDDGSTDSSASIVENYGDSRVHLFKKSNGGVSSARNYGASMAKNDWLIFLDADDLIQPCSLSVFGNLISKYPRDEVFVGNYMQIQHGKMVVTCESRERVSQNPMKDIWYSHYYMQPGAFCLSKSAFVRSGGYDTRMSYNEDFEYCLRLATNFRVVCTPQVVLEYVTEGAEASQKVHQVEKDFAYYITSINCSNIYTKLLLYRNIHNSIIKRYACKNEESAILLTKILNEKFSKLFELFFYFCSKYWMLLRKIRHYRLYHEF